MNLTKEMKEPEAEEIAKEEMYREEEYQEAMKELEVELL